MAEKLGSHTALEENLSLVPAPISRGPQHPHQVDHNFLYEGDPIPVTPLT